MPTPAQKTIKATQLDLSGIAAYFAGTPTTGIVSSVALATSTLSLSGTNPVVSSGTITVNLSTTAVTPGSYTNTDLTVDAYGRITAASNGSSTSGVTSAIAGTNINVSSATGAVTISVTGTVASATTATNIAAGTANQIPYQTGAGATSFYSSSNYGVHTYSATGVPQSIAGAAGVLEGSASAIPAFTTTPTLTGTNFTGIPNAALTNSSVTIGSTSVSLGSTVTAFAGVTTLSMSGQLTNTVTTGTAPFVVSSTTQVANLNVATAGTATNIAAGTANQIPYQTGAGATSFYSSANYGVHTYGATGVPASVAGAAGVLQGSASAIPAFTTTPTLTGTNFTGIPNGALTNSSVTIGSTAVALGATVTTFAGLTSVTSTGFTGALTGNADSATNVGVTNNAGASSATWFPTFVSAGTGNLPATVDSTVNILSYVPNTGTLNATVLNATSDRKLKTNITRITNALDIVKSLNGVRFNWINSGTLSAGLIAQDVEAVMPELVTTSELRDQKSLNYNGVIGALVEALKEMSATIDGLKAEIAQLKAK